MENGGTRGIVRSDEYPRTSPYRTALTGAREHSARAMVFDAIFPRGTRLQGPGEPPLAVERRYEPAHNVGHYRYIEAGQLDGRVQPAGDITVWDEVWLTRPAHLPVDGGSMPA